jgi:thioredoxin 1
MEVTITKDNFEEEVTQSPVPVVLDFWAEWCMPCKMIAPVLARLAEEYDGKLKIGKLNVDEEVELATEFNIVSIPTLLFFKDGEIVNQHIGHAPKAQLESMIGKIL